MLATIKIGTSKILRIRILYWMSTDFRGGIVLGKVYFQKSKHLGWLANSYGTGLAMIHDFAYRSGSIPGS